MSFWQRYWFSPAPCLDLAVVRIVAVSMQLFLMLVFSGLADVIVQRAALPAGFWDPLIISNIIHLPWGWGFRPSLDVVQTIYFISVATGFFALVGCFTNIALLVFAATCVYVQAFSYSFGDYHHPEAVMMIALSVLAISPSGRVLSVDAWLRGRRAGRGEDGLLNQTSEFAGWPIKLIQWFFALMYASAVWNKLGVSGLEWANGFTLQWILARDGLRWDSPLGYWLSHHHTLVLIAQYGVVLFQGTFALAVIFPKLRWIYVPAGLCLHTVIYLTLKAPFFQWIALYAVFIPWTEALGVLRARWGNVSALAAKTG